MRENKQFMKDVLACYLNQNRAELTECYRAAKKAAEMRKDAWIPSLSTVRREVKRLPEDVVMCGRGGLL